MSKKSKQFPDYNIALKEYEEKQAKALADQKALYEKQHQEFLAAEEQKRVVSEQNNLMSMVGQRQSQESAATSYVDKALKAEQSRAAVSGVEFAITPEQRAQRISDQLATLRTATDDQAILDLAGKYSDFATKNGVPLDGKFAVGLGKAPVDLTKKPSGSGSASSASLKPTVLGTGEDEKLNNKTVLG
jgi:hypothetical protein